MVCLFCTLNLCLVVLQTFCFHGDQHKLRYKYSKKNLKRAAHLTQSSRGKKHSPFLLDYSLILKTIFHKFVFCHSVITTVPCFTSAVPHLLDRLTCFTFSIPPGTVLKGFIHSLSVFLCLQSLSLHFIAVCVWLICFRFIHFTLQAKWINHFRSLTKTPNHDNAIPFFTQKAI